MTAVSTQNASIGFLHNVRPLGTLLCCHCWLPTSCLVLWLQHDFLTNIQLSMVCSQCSLVKIVFLGTFPAYQSALSLGPNHVRQIQVVWCYMAIGFAAFDPLQVVPAKVECLQVVWFGNPTVPSSYLWTFSRVSSPVWMAHSTSPLACWWCGLHVRCCTW